VVVVVLQPLLLVLILQLPLLIWQELAFNSTIDTSL